MNDLNDIQLPYTVEELINVLDKVYPEKAPRCGPVKFPPVRECCLLRPDPPGKSCDAENGKAGV